MRLRVYFFLFGLLVLLRATAYARDARWVHLDTDGRLVYAQSPRGDRIPDFSNAGYRGGGVAIPTVATRKIVSPTVGADDTPVIQAALDEVGQLAPGPDGHRGTVELSAGTFHLAGTLQMTVPGVVLRGAGGSGNNASVLVLTAAPHLAIEMNGDFQIRPAGTTTSMTDVYVPAGAKVIHLKDTSNIRPGDSLLIVKPVTAAWVHFMQMDNLQRDGTQVWIKNDIHVRRRVVAIVGDAVTLDVPLTDSFDSKFYPDIQPAVTPVIVSGQLAEVGVEDLRISAPNRVVNLNHDAEFDGVRMDNLVDSWLRSVSFENTTDTMRIGRGCERLTLVEVDVQQHDTVSGHAKPLDFSINGAQILLDRCSGKGDSVFYVATQSGSEGPVVVLHCRFNGDGAIEPHQRWSTGLLVDSCEVPGGRINLMNRGEMGSGQGWAIGWSVLWNNYASTITVQNPPGSANWSIGDRGVQVGAPMPTPGKRGKGPLLDGGIIESGGKPVEPASLYLQQLRERLGPAAVAAIGYP
jgi:hypothetical protein